MDCPLRNGSTPLAFTPYRSDVGGLMFIAKMTRPDIQFAVTATSRYNQDPGSAHWAAVKWILSYLAGTINHGLCYSETDSVDHLVSDSDFADCQDTRRSTSGLIFIFNGGPVSWTSKLQKPIANSIAEAEYYAAGHASREIAWLQSLQNAMLMVQNPVFHDRTKHIDIEYHYVRQQYQAKIIELQSVRSEDELADMLTKPLKPQELKMNRSRIGIVPVPQD
ncbi:secreted RxLR effector protein 161-like [Daphnia magna]|uniref:secreted RxLR effector protein 161-like n=1 Tax=Daphnia magna TaxID=35525 RepID=UPI001E1BAAA8|nr:secreted RxLR effector protein 161-like [Daphnia magna]